MLVLSRKIGERIIIGREITLTVIEIHGSRVRLGIGAPNDVPIRRFELNVDSLSDSSVQSLMATAPKTKDELAIDGTLISINSI